MKKECRRCGAEFETQMCRQVYCNDPECHDPKAQTRFWYEKSKELGVCPQCGRPSDGLVQCEECRAKQIAHMKRWRQENRDYVREYKRELRQRPGREDPNRVLREVMEVTTC